MTRYHVNPETMRPNQCTATKQGCKFKDTDGNEPEHFSSKTEAINFVSGKLEKEAKADGSFLASQRKPRKSNATKENLEKIAGEQFDNYHAHQYTYMDVDVTKKRAEFIKKAIREPNAEITLQEWRDDHDENGNTIYLGKDSIRDKITYDGQNFTRLDPAKGIYSDYPYAVRIQVGKELSEEEFDKMADLINYQYSKTGGERDNGFSKDSPNSLVYYSDTTKNKAGRRMDEFFEALPETIKNGSDLRKTDRSGPGTKGTRRYEGIGDTGYMEFYADNTTE